MPKSRVAPFFDPRTGRRVLEKGHVFVGDDNNIESPKIFAPDIISLGEGNILVGNREGVAEESLALKDLISRLLMVRYELSLIEESGTFILQKSHELLPRAQALDALPNGILKHNNGIINIVTLGNKKILRGDFLGIPQESDDLSTAEDDIKKRVKGPSSAKINSVARFSDEDGKSITESLVTIDSDGDLYANSLYVRTGGIKQGFKASGIALTTLWTLPLADGLPGQLLATTGTGQLYWRYELPKHPVKNPDGYPIMTPLGFPVWPIIVGAIPFGAIPIFIAADGTMIGGSAAIITPFGSLITPGDIDAKDIKSKGNVSVSGTISTEASLTTPDLNLSSCSLDDFGDKVCSVIKVRPPDTLAQNYTINLPPAPGAPGQILSTNDEGDWEWKDEESENLDLVGDILGAGLIGSPITTKFKANPVFTGNASMTIPVGTLAQRPAMPVVGMERFTITI